MTKAMTKAVQRPLTVVLPERYDGDIEVTDATGAVVQKFPRGVSATAAYAIVTQASNAKDDAGAAAVLALWGKAAEWTGIAGHQRETHHALRESQRTGKPIPVTGVAVWEMFSELELRHYERGQRVYLHAQGAWRRAVVLNVTKQKVVAIYRNLDRETGYVTARKPAQVRLHQDVVA